MKIMDCISLFVNEMEISEPIFTNDIYEYVKRRIPNVKKNVLNEYINRFEKMNPNFVRYQKGIYYKTSYTPFGSSDIKYNDLIKKTYINSGDEVYGYESGPSYINKIGLTTQMPSCTYIVTKKNRAYLSIPNNNVKLLKPIIEINNDNYHYLQFLDILDNKYKVPFDSNNYKEIMRNYIDKYNLDFEKLLYYAKYYNNNKIYDMLANLANGGSF